MQNRDRWSLPTVYWLCSCCQGSPLSHVQLSLLCMAPRLFLAELLCRQSGSSLCYCQELFLPKCRALCAAFLNFIRFLLACSSCLSRSLWSGSPALECIDWSSPFGITCKLDKIIAWCKLLKRNGGPRADPCGVYLDMSLIAMVFEVLQSQLLIPDYKTGKFIVVVWAYVLKRGLNAFFQEADRIVLWNSIQCITETLTGAKFIILYYIFNISSNVLLGYLVKALRYLSTSATPRCHYHCSW